MKFRNVSMLGGKERWRNRGQKTLENLVAPAHDPLEKMIFGSGRPSWAMGGQEGVLAAQQLTSGKGEK